MRNKKSLANRNIIILILSILPFFIGLGISVYQSSDTEYFSVAINISGSQRMRTMLISNYLQSYVQSYNGGEKIEREEYKELLTDEIEIYKKFYLALKFGDEEVALKNNRFQEIISELECFEDGFFEYVARAEKCIKNPEDKESLQFVIHNAMIIKDKFDETTGLFQKINDEYIDKQRNIDVGMISFGAIVTIIGIVFSLKIRQKEYHANYDYLTKLKNRHSLFEDVLQLDIKKCIMFFIDLNKFKIINDTFGHKTGDEILKSVSILLKSIFGADNLYRYGGDEFIAIIENNGVIKAKDLIENTVNEMKRKLSEAILDTLGREHYVGLSMGIVSSEVQIENWENMINLADDLMYDSKSVAGNVIICHTRHELEERIKFSRVIDKIFNESSIKLNFQPIFSICTDEIFFYNVTSTWENEEGHLTAYNIIPILKRKGYLTEVDKNTFFKLEKNYLENSLSSVKYIMNLSEDTLRNYKINNIINVLSKIKVPKESLVIKVHYEMLDIKEIYDGLLKIKALGCSLAVDSIFLDITLQNIDKYREIEIFKIGNSLSSALIKREDTKIILIEFIKIFNKIGKKIIVEGIDREDLLQSMEDCCIDSNDDMVFYSSLYKTIE